MWNATFKSESQIEWEHSQISSIRMSEDGFFNTEDLMKSETEKDKKNREQEEAWRENEQRIWEALRQEWSCESHNASRLWHLKIYHKQIIPFST